MRSAALLCGRLLTEKKLVVYTPFARVKEKETPESENILIEELRTGKSDPHYHPAFDPDVFDDLSMIACVEKRRIPGAPAPEMVQQAIDSAREKLSR